jgi:hypothetical protein
MSEAAKNRAAFPKFAAVMDEVRALWPDARVRYINEGGRTLGAIPEPDEGVWGEIDGDTWLWAASLGKKEKRR